MNIIEKTYTLNGSLTKRSKTDTIVLHHRAGDGDVEGVDRIHKNNEWTCIGYHFYVRKDGSIYRGRQEDTVGAHAYGYNNTSIGICAEGNFETDIMSEAQKQALKELVAYIKEKYGITKVVRHKDLGNTACPGKNYPFEEIRDYKAVANVEPAKEVYDRGTVGTNKKLKQNCNLWSNGDLSGVFYSYLKNTTVKVLENTSVNVDKIYVPATGRTAYIDISNYTETTESQAKTMTVTAKSGLNVRAGAGTNHKIVTAYPYGTKVKVYSIENGWAKGEKGYMCATYLK